MTITFRKLTEEDAAAFRKVRLEALEKYPDSFLVTKEQQESMTEEQQRQRFRNHQQGQFIAGAFSGDELVGMMGVMQEMREKIKHKAALVAVYMSEKYQGAGIAGKLLDYSIQQAKKIGGIEQLQLAVATDNDPAINLYKRKGFQVYGTEKNALKSDGRYIDEHLMVLFL
ncbi:GNAT family N-acetyltransferase [Fictibacillus iocasae]|uniref:GNAT family N-acetyltransferase n=1 Tax=Fictibacillus iocasae TaxID=2715437 RepID=A0ABW2NXZ5_9BACL